MMLAIYRAAEAVGLSSWEAINVRLGARRIVIPDLVVGSIDFIGSVAEASDVLLVSEILSPTSARDDRVDKLREYAEAGIPWCLLAEPDLSD